MAAKRKNDRRSLKTLDPNWVLPVPSSQNVVTVQSVQQTSPSTLQWTFSSGVSISGGNVPQLQASGDGINFVSPISVSVVGGGGVGAVAAIYPVTAIFAQPMPAGSIFRIVSTPTNITFATGNLSLPQSGQVSLPSIIAAQKPKKRKTVKANPRRTGKSAGRTLRITGHAATRASNAKSKAA